MGPSHKLPGPHPQAVGSQTRLSVLPFPERNNSRKSGQAGTRHKTTSLRKQIRSKYGEGGGTVPILSCSKGNHHADDGTEFLACTGKDGVVDTRLAY